MVTTESKCPINCIPVIAFLTGAFLAIEFKHIYLYLSKWRDQIHTQAEIRSEHTQSHRPPPIADGIEGCIGNTPLMRIKSLSEATGSLRGQFLNGAGGSPKDRVALHIIQTAERQGLLTPHSGDIIYEGTVGSTGISLATLARAKGYLAHICMPSDQSTEKSNLLLKLGASVDRVPPAPIVEKDHFVNKARKLAGPTDSSSPEPSFPLTREALANNGESNHSQKFFADQFENPANWQAHFHTTGPEIFTQCDGRLDAFVSGAGTGGTISGVALYLKPRLPGMKVVLADPQGSGLLNRVRYGVMYSATEQEGTRRRQQVDSIIEGIGNNRSTLNFEAGQDLIDDAIRVTDAQAIAMAKWLVEKDGIFVGSSSAVNCFAALTIARTLGPGHRIVTVLCDSGARHLSKFWKNAGNVADSSGSKLEDLFTAGNDRDLPRS